MKEDVVTYEIAIKLREKEFDEPCDMYYHIHDDIADCVSSLESTGFGDCCFYNSNNKYRCAAPTIYQVLKWLREEKKLFVEPSLFKYGYESYVQSTIFEDDKDYTDTWYVEGFYSTYERAALVGIEYVLDNLI